MLDPLWGLVKSWLRSSENTQALMDERLEALCKSQDLFVRLGSKERVQIKSSS